MRYVRFCCAVILLPSLLAGCASTGGEGLSKDAQCAIIGAAVGGALGGFVLDGELAGGLVGAGAGAVLSGLACNEGDADGDGVPDAQDKCPDTPAGIKVDATGCPLDSDGDGVPDTRDQCPNTGAGVQVDDKGCPVGGDADGDGVPDDSDRCPNTPAGAKVDASGCPLDSDGDGVADYIDQCPDTPKGWNVDSRGCDVAIVFRNINFDHDKSTLTAASRKILDEKIVALLEANPKVGVRIVGHTDSRGTNAYNDALSLRRAVAVRKYLESKGIQRGRMETAGKGEGEPVAPNSTKAGRALNRRVEFYALK